MSSDNGWAVAVWWLFSLGASLAVIAGRVGRALWGIGKDPPDDAEAFRHWERRRRWLAYSEISSLPAFATIAVTATIYFELPPIASVGISMVLGAVGFGAVLDAAMYLFRKRLGVSSHDLA